MGIWKKQQSANSPATPQPASLASRQQADDIRRKAQHYTDITEQTGDQSNDRCTATQQREQAEREMAALRAEALQARRLATQIENLHQPAPVQRKGRIMDTTIADPGQAQRMARRTTDNPSPAGGKLNFNPLHPSMELPPEQLIRLLGLENKTKRRKKRPEPVADRARERKSTDATIENEPVKLSLPKIPPASAEREQDTIPLPFGDSHRRLLIPSLIAGTVAGIVISAYLFWSNPEDVATPVTQAAPASKTDKNTRPLTKADATRTLPTVAPAETARQGTVDRTETVPRTAIDAEEKRLRSEAEQRFAERITKQKLPSADTAPSAVIKPSVGGNTTMPYDSLDANNDDQHIVTSTEDDAFPATTETDTLPPTEEQITTPATTTSLEPTAQEFQATTPDNEALPVEVTNGLDITVEAAAVAEPDSTPAELNEADVVRDSDAEEVVSEDLF